MQLRQLVTVLGFCLSQVYAIPAVDPDTDATVRSIVQLVTAPHEALETGTSKLSKDQIRDVGETPYLYSHQIVAGLGEAHNSLAYLAEGENGKISSLIEGSMLGYTHTILAELPENVKKSRFEIYRNSLYSRIHDFVRQVGPQAWHEKAQVAVGNLKNELQQAILKLTKVQVSPAGDKEILEKIKKITAQFQEDHKAILQKMSRMEKHMITHLPSQYELAPMEYRSVEEVENALKETNVAHVPAAMPVDFVIHQHPVPEKASPVSEKVSSPPTHHVLHAQPPATLPQAAAAA
ncbi:hypothetical protein PCANC_04865 [Puccinia coronata f. sp. avenae]|uniref:Uncharacterized protein n=1 Tax=Puccinia coronata f. sp. avenae TaxID=200324 RepID=A0A2N5TF55_9BASI|nr:hypothetical protein PCASD_14922 [Puccinia coronata f. sp. avenae]PLW56461.1 hypothetical protein PCANC_04865 [Puccinia coronata f. sp. avenae]